MQALVTYSAAQPFLSSENWKHLHEALRTQFPLRGLHWKPSSQSSIRTIQKLDVSLVPLDLSRDEHTSQVPATLLEKPFVHLYIVICEDVDTYRTTVKKEIKDWHSALPQRKNQEWLIVHIVRPDAKIVDKKFFNMKTSVLDKVKADFNVDKKDRCVQLAWSTGQDNPAIWADFISKLKEGILSAFDSAVSQRQDEVKRSEGQRHMPGWNFCTFFILKESLATSFEGVNLFDDALLEYTELEFSFVQVLREKNLSWFGSLINVTSKDDSQPLLSVTKKSYRDLILANTISIFDFRIYLLARQCALLKNMGRIVEVCRRAGAFLGTFGRRLREVENTLPLFFIESWIYSSALSVVEQCDFWVSTIKLEGSHLTKFSAARGELIELAKNQLDIIGVKLGHLPSASPFSIALPDGVTPVASNGSQKSSTSQSISNQELLRAIADREIFYDLYVSTCNNAIDMYAKANRRKFALKLHGCLAALDIHRGRLHTALATYTSLPAHYAPHMWTALEAYMLSRAVETHDQLDKEHDREWIHIVLSLLKAYVTDAGKELLFPDGGIEFYISQLVGSLRSAVGELEADLPHPDHPAIFISFLGDAKSAEAEDTVLLDVAVENRLPCDIPIDQVSVVLSGRNKERLKFVTEDIDRLVEGKNVLTLRCPTSSWGAYVLENSEVRMSHLHFQWSRQGFPSKKPSSALVHIPKDHRSLDVKLRQPRYVELNSTSRVLLILSTGRNEISKATIKLTAPLGVYFTYSDARLESSGRAELETAKDSISIWNISRDTTIAVSIPHSSTSTYHTMPVDIAVTYTNLSEKGLLRTLRASRVVPLALSVVVNVEDFFRPDRLLTKFTVSTTDHQYVRIYSAQLEGPEDLKLKQCRFSLPVVTVTPAQPGSFLFLLESPGGPVRESLHFILRYTMLREEVEALIESSVDAALSSFQALSSQRRILVQRLVTALEADASWVRLYDITGEVHVPASFDDQEELAGALNAIRILLAQSQPMSIDSIARELKIPVDLPRMNIVAAVRIRILSSSLANEPSEQIQSIYSGQPINAVIEIRSSFCWGDPDAKGSHHKMRYDIQEMVKEWLVSGRKRGDFVGEAGTTFYAPITLIALHHGELLLPKVAIRPLALTSGTSTPLSMPPTITIHQLHGAEKVLVLPRGGRSTFLVNMGGEN